MWLVTITEVARKSNEIPLLSGKHRRLIDTYASHGEETRLQTYQGACGFLEDEHWTDNQKCETKLVRYCQWGMEMTVWDESVSWLLAWISSCRDVLGIWEAVLRSKCVCPKLNVSSSTTTFRYKRTFSENKNYETANDDSCGCYRSRLQMTQDCYGGRGMEGRNRLWKVI